jgi:hypothetical protein
MDVCMYVWMDGWMDGCVHVCMYVCMDGCIYVYMYVCTYAVFANGSVQSLHDALDCMEYTGI